MSKGPLPRQLALTFKSEGSAEANGEDTITLTATLTDGDSLVSGEVITFIATNGAFFPDGESSIISVTTNSQGKAVAGLACSTPGTFNVTALLARDSGVNASVSVVFGDGGSTGDLPAPAVDEAVNGRIPADTSTLTLRIPAWTGMATGDHLTYFWQATSADGISNTLHDGIPLVSSDIGKDMVFTLEPGTAVNPYDGGNAEAWYTVMPAGSSVAKESAHADWAVGEAPGLPAPVVEEADGNNIDLAGLSDNVHVSLSWPSMAANDQVALFWLGTDGSGTAHPEQQVTSHRVTDNDVQAGQVRLPLSVAMYLTPYENGSVQSYYTLNRADGSDTAYSEKATYQVAPVFKTLFEDFEGNSEILIEKGESITLAHSGAILKNISVRGMVNITEPPYEYPDMVSLCLHTDYSAQSEIRFPVPFKTIQFGIMVPINHKCQLEFYDINENLLETAVFDPGNDTYGVFNHTIKNGIADIIRISGRAWVDNITINR